MKKLLPFFLLLLIASCKQQQLKSFNNVIDDNDTISIMMDSSQVVSYHSQKLGISIEHPSFLMHQNTDEADRFEIFMYNDISFTVSCDSIDSLTGYSPGQQFMGMGAELLSATDRYALMTGSDEGVDYYAKIIDDSMRVVTLTLRYSPDHEDAVLGLKQWIDDYDPLLDKK
jgi:hypothetical protein